MYIDWPLDSNYIRRGKLNHTFGMVRRNRNGTKRPHQGWDFEAEVGTPCYAIANGTIVSVVHRGAYGLRVLMRFDYDYDRNGSRDALYAFYAHLDRADVKVGQAVKQGQQIGLTGNSGNASTMRGPDNHLHFEIRTRRWVGRGLDGRISPLNVFRHCPLHEPVLRGAA